VTHFQHLNFINKGQHMNKRQTVGMLTFLLITTLGIGTGQAQPITFPNQTIKWIVPYTPGGTTDVIARQLSVPMGKSIGQPIVADNRPGAASIIGATFIARSAPDGYTVGTADSGTLAFNPAMYSTLTYNAQKDFTFIGGLGRMPLVLAVKPNFPAKNLQEFLALAKKSPGTVSSASSGAGSPLHVALELFKQKTQTNILHVPYKGSAPALQDLMAGQVDSMFVDLPPSLSMIRSGKIRVLAIATPQRLPLLSDIPTMTESGLVGFEAYAWQGFVGPAKLPTAVIERLNHELNAALAQTETKAKLEELGIQPMPMSPKQFSDFVQSEQQLWSGVIKAADIRMD
jgi:tripartite-type tricarboxylate transporter receptor subunit TctC